MPIDQALKELIKNSQSAEGLADAIRTRENGNLKSDFHDLFNYMRDEESDNDFGKIYAALGILEKELNNSQRQELATELAFSTFSDDDKERVQASRDSNTQFHTDFFDNLNAAWFLGKDRSAAPKDEDIQKYLDSVEVNSGLEIVQEILKINAALKIILPEGSPHIAALDELSKNAQKNLKLYIESPQSEFEANNLTTKEHKYSNREHNTSSLAALNSIDKNIGIYGKAIERNAAFLKNSEDKSKPYTANKTAREASKEKRAELAKGKDISIEDLGKSREAGLKDISDRYNVLANKVSKMKAGDGAAIRELSDEEKASLSEISADIETYIRARKTEVTLANQLISLATNEAVQAQIHALQAEQNLQEAKLAAKELGGYLKQAKDDRKLAKNIEKEAEKREKKAEKKIDYLERRLTKIETTLIKETNNNIEEYENKLSTTESELKKLKEKEEKTLPDRLQEKFYQAQKKYFEGRIKSNEERLKELNNEAKETPNKIKEQKDIIETQKGIAKQAQKTIAKLDEKIKDLNEQLKAVEKYKNLAKEELKSAQKDLKEAIEARSKYISQKNAALGAINQALDKKDKLAELKQEIKGKEEGKDKEKDKKKDKGFNPPIKSTAVGMAVVLVLLMIFAPHLALPFMTMAMLGLAGMGIAKIFNTEGFKTLFKTIAAPLTIVTDLLNGLGKGVALAAGGIEAAATGKSLADTVGGKVANQMPAFMGVTNSLFTGKPIVNSSPSNTKSNNPSPAPTNTQTPPTQPSPSPSLQTPTTSPTQDVSERKKEDDNDKDKDKNNSPSAQNEVSSQPTPTSPTHNNAEVNPQNRPRSNSAPQKLEQNNPEVAPQNRQRSNSLPPQPQTRASVAYLAETNPAVAQAIGGLSDQFKQLNQDLQGPTDQPLTRSKSTPNLNKVSPSK